VLAAGEARAAARAGPGLGLQATRRLREAAGPSTRSRARVLRGLTAAATRTGTATLPAVMCRAVSLVDLTISRLTPTPTGITRRHQATITTANMTRTTTVGICRHKRPPRTRPPVTTRTHACTRRPNTIISSRRRCRMTMRRAGLGLWLTTKPIRRSRCRRPLPTESRRVDRALRHLCSRHPH